jgi:hypothetical protein
MADATDIYGTVFKNSSVTLLARIVDENGANIQLANIAAAEYTAYLLDDQDADARIAVIGHAGVSLTPANVLHDSLQTDAVWTVDTTGYNFRHTLDVSSHPVFTVAGRRYLIEYRLTPNAGQILLIRFRLNVI